MLWLAIEVQLCLEFLAPIALYSAAEVVILTLRAHPATVWEVELLLVLILRIVQI